MPHITDIPAKEIAKGLQGYYAHGASSTFGYIEIKAGSVVGLHHHIHEQITYIMDGQLDMIIGGIPCSLTKGMYYVIPSNTPHSAVAAMDCKVIDVFSPVREDYR